MALLTLSLTSSAFSPRSSFPLRTRNNMQFVSAIFQVAIGGEHATASASTAPVNGNQQTSSSSSSSSSAPPPLNISAQRFALELLTHYCRGSSRAAILLEGAAQAAGGSGGGGAANIAAANMDKKREHQCALAGARCHLFFVFANDFVSL
jgi:hypothetical protein